MNFIFRFIVLFCMLMLSACVGSRSVSPTSSSNQPVFASVTGTVTTLQRIALPSEAVVIVQLQDVSRADAPASILAEQRIERPGPVPLAFELRYDSRAIDPAHRYAISARILRNGRLWFIGDQNTAVITQNNPAHVEILLKMVAQSEN